MAAAAAPAPAPGIPAFSAHDPPAPPSTRSWISLSIDASGPVSLSSAACAPVFFLAAFGAGSPSFPFAAGAAAASSFACTISFSIDVTSVRALAISPNAVVSSAFFANSSRRVSSSRALTVGLPDVSTCPSL